MFSQKKKNFTWIYVCGILAVLILAVLILIGALSTHNEEAALQANLESKVDEKTAAAPTPKGVPDEDTITEDKKTDELAEDERENQFYQSYYLVKQDNNVIKIFFSDETGNLVKLEETGIVYETLAPEDQKKFKDGIKVESRDELNRLIMNYES